MDHLDLDRATAEALVDCGVVAVVNASPFISGRYPNLGPELLARSGVVMVDDVGSDVFTGPRRQHGRVHEGALIVGDTTVATGHELGAEEIGSLMEDARSGLSTQLQSFTHNTTEFLRREQELLLHGQGVPKPARSSTAARGRRGPGVRLPRGPPPTQRFIREQRPVLVGVDAGADALIAAGHRPDIVVVGEEGLAQGSTAGERGSTVSDKGCATPREVVLHADRWVARSAVTASTASASGTRPSRRPAPARTSPCSSPTSGAPA